MPKPLTQLRQETEIELLKTALRDTVEDLKRSQVIIDGLKTALKIADFTFEMGQKTIKAQQEELVVWRMRSGN